MVKWNQLKDSMEGMPGFIARAYKGLEGSDPARSEADCTSKLKALDRIIEGLEPSTNYTITVAVFKGLQGNLRTIYGDASIAVHIKTGQPQHTAGRVNHVHFHGLNGSITAK